MERVTSAEARLGEAVERSEWTYDGGVFGTGRMTTMTDPTGSTAYGYDRRGLLIREAKTVAGGTYTTRFAYDRDGNRTAVTYPSGRVVTSSFDLAGRPIGASLDGVPLVSGVEYLPFGPAVAAAYGNGTQRQSTYDSRYRMLTNQLVGALGPLASYAYGYDAAGNVTAIDDLIDRGYDRDYGYDDLNRLTRADGGSGLWGAGTYAYDAMGNLTSLALGTARTAAFTHVGTTPKLASVSENGTARSVAYDAAGNEVTVGASTYGYSPRNALSEGDGAAFGYDGRGVRTLTTRGSLGRVSLYTPELSLMAESEESTLPGRAIVNEYVWFGGQPLVQIESATGAVHWYFDDHLGTPLLQTDALGAVIWQAEYEPYGSVYACRSGATRHQPLRFPGQEAGDGEVAYNIFRWYRSSWGRYTQADPIGLQGGVNLYAYAFDNPITYDDPFGLRVRMCCRIIPFTTLLAHALSMMPPGASPGAQRHCFFQFENSPNNEPLGLHGSQSMLGLARGVLGRGTGRVINNAGFDRGRDASDLCGPWADDPCNDVDQCVRNAGGNYPSPSRYSMLFGPNSNTFAFHVARQCYVKPPWPVQAPGWNAAPPQP